MSFSEAATQTTPLLPRDEAEESAGPSVQPEGKQKHEPGDYVFNWQVSRRPWRLFEWCDLPIVPGFIRRRTQAILTAQWTHKLPFVQDVAPAERAAALIYELIHDVANGSQSKISVVDFCSGGGGPIPTIEKLVNNTRVKAGLRPIPFVITDLHPHLDSWLKCASDSDYMSFIPQSVDAIDPPAAVISRIPVSDVHDTSSTRKDSEFSSGAKIIRLYCLAFHHFDDETARKVLVSTLKTADGFAIIELQDRRLYSLVMMLLDLPLVLLASPFWFWRDPLQLIFTYLLPVIPPIMSFDGFVSALRTRTFEEVVLMIDDALAAVANKNAQANAVHSEQHVDSLGRVIKELTRKEWTIKGRQEMHTWPLGWMNSIVGVKKTSSAGGS